MLTINVVTLFPEVFQAALAVSIPGRAAERGLARYRVLQLRDYTHDRHHTVDDSPYGGGAGMVLKPEPFFEAVEDLRAGAPIVLLSARGWCSSRSRSSRRWKICGRGRPSCCCRHAAGRSATATPCGSRWASS